MATPLANDMSRLLNKIERQLKIIPIYDNLPERFQKPEWARVIKEDTMSTFSRYFPHRMRYHVDQNTAIRKDGWYFLDDNIIGDNKVLGITDIDWQQFGNMDGSLATSGAYGYPDAFLYGQGYGNASILADQIIGYSLNGDLNSLFSGGAGIYVETDVDIPNKFRIMGYSGQTFALKNFDIFVLLQHKDLNTISPTKMEIFEQLAKCDVATFLCNLKYFDGFETIFATVDLKISDLESESNKRDDIIAKLDDAHVSYSNLAMPLIVTQ